MFTIKPVKNKDTEYDNHDKRNNSDKKNIETEYGQRLSDNEYFEYLVNSYNSGGGN